MVAKLDFQAVWQALDLVAPRVPGAVDAQIDAAGGLGEDFVEGVPGGLLVGVSAVDDGEVEVEAVGEELVCAHCFVGSVKAALSLASPYAALWKPSGAIEGIVHESAPTVFPYKDLVCVLVVGLVVAQILHNCKSYFGEFLMSHADGSHYCVTVHFVLQMRHLASRTAVVFQQHPVHPRILASEVLPRHPQSLFSYEFAKIPSLYSFLLKKHSFFPEPHLVEPESVEHLVNQGVLQCLHIFWHPRDVDAVDHDHHIRGSLFLHHDVTNLCICQELWIESYYLYVQDRVMFPLHQGLLAHLGP